MPHDDIDHIPSMVPTRDSDNIRPTGNGGARKSRPAGARASVPKKSGGSSALDRLGMTIALVVAAVACAWAWQLQQALQESNVRAEDYASRIGELEARLSDTDQGMNQNAEVQAAKIRELDSEVRKLWDNVWKQTSARLDALEKDSTARGKKLDTTAAGLAAIEAQIKGVSADLGKLKSVADSMDRVIASGKLNQAEVERVADTINRVNLDLAKLNKRVQGNEEWIQSINAFRKQVNASLVELQAALRAQSQ